MIKLGPGESEPHSQWLSIAEVATALHISEPTVWRLIRSGELAAIKPGLRRWVTSAGLDRYLRRLDESAERDRAEREQAVAEGLPVPEGEPEDVPEGESEEPQ